jgi:hypothetical protein
MQGLNENRQRSGRAGLATQETDSGPGGRLSLSDSDSTPSAAGCQAARLPIYGPDGQRVVAVIVDGSLTKLVDGSKHFLRNPPAIAIDAGAIAEAEALGVEQIAVTDRESGRTYRAALSEFYAHSWRFDRGYGAQRAMRLTRWHTNGEPTPAVNTAPRPVAEPVQPGVVLIREE